MNRNEESSIEWCATSLTKYSGILVLGRNPSHGLRSRSNKQTKV